MLERCKVLCVLPTPIIQRHDGTHLPLGQVRELLEAVVISGTLAHRSHHSTHARANPPSIYYFFFFNDPAPPEIYPLPLHAPLPISRCPTARNWGRSRSRETRRPPRPPGRRGRQADRSAWPGWESRPARWT